MASDYQEGGRLEEAAECFYAAMGRHPSRELEITIAVKLCRIYAQLGLSDLALEIMASYETSRDTTRSLSQIAEIKDCIADINKAGRM